jgi:hypothetical protein
MTSIKLFALLIFLTGGVAEANMYRWVDANGKVTFSDKVPPAMSQKGHTSLSKNGIESSKVSSAEELKLKKEEEDKKTEILAEMTEAKKAEAEQNRKDEQLLATYDNREELNGFFMKKLSNLDQSIGILGARDESLTAKLQRLNQKYKLTKATSARSSLLREIKDAQETLLEYQKAISLNRADKKDVLDKYRKTLIRFDHLTQASH